MNAKLATRPTYFSCADGGIEHALTQAEFHNSLIHNLLFEPDGLLLPDVFFFRKLAQAGMDGQRTVITTESSKASHE